MLNLKKWDNFLYAWDLYLFGKKQYRKYGNMLGLRLNRNYTKLAKKSRQKFKELNNGKEIPYQNNYIRTQGPQLIKNVLPQEKADEIRKMISIEIEKNGKNIFGKNDLYKEIINSAPLFGRSFFDQLLGQKEVDEALKNFFGSYYQIICFSTYRTYYSDKHTSSFLWHIDNLPSETLKFFIFYTPSRLNYEGGTSFLKKEETTRVVEETGYAGLENERIYDIASWANKHHINSLPAFFEANTGDGLFFQSNLLHKGEPPATLNHNRDISCILFCPSEKPWHETFDINSIDVPFRNGGYYIYPESKKGNPVDVMNMLSRIKKRFSYVQ